MLNWEAKTSDVLVTGHADFFDSDALASAEEVDAVLSAITCETVSTGQLLPDGTEQKIASLVYMPTDVEWVVVIGRGIGSWSTPLLDESNTEATFAAVVAAGINKRPEAENTGVIVPAVPGVSIDAAQLTRRQSRALRQGNLQPIGEALAVALTKIVEDNNVPISLVAASASASLMAATAPELAKTGRSLEQICFIEPVGLSKRGMVSLILDSIATQKLEPVYKELDHSAIREASPAEFSAHKVLSPYLGNLALYAANLARGKALEPLMAIESVLLLNGSRIKIMHGRHSEFRGNDRAVTEITQHLAEIGYTSVREDNYLLGAHAMAGSPVLFVDAISK